MRSARGRGDPRHRRAWAWCARPTPPASRPTASGPATRPCYVEASADIAKAADDILAGKTLRQRRAVLVAELGRGRPRGGAGAAARRFQAGGGYFLTAAETDRLAQALVGPAAAAQSGAGRQVGAAHRRGTSASRCPPARARSSPRSPASAATIRCRSRSCARCCPTTRWTTGARAASAAPRSCATAAWATRMSIHSQNDAGHPRVRPAQAGVPHLREHADDARLDRPDDRPRPGDDARLRRLRRQHHLRQHHAAAPAEHQARWPTSCGRARRPRRRRRRQRRPPAPAGAAPGRCRARRSRPPPERRSPPSGVADGIDRWLAAPRRAGPGAAPAPAAGSPRPPTTSSARTTCARRRARRPAVCSSGRGPSSRPAARDAGAAATCFVWLDGARRANPRMRLAVAAARTAGGRFDPAARPAC